MIGAYTLNLVSGMEDYLVVKSDLEGNLIQAVSYGDSSEQVLREFQLTSDGGFILAGYEIKDSALRNSLLLKLGENF